MLAATGKTKNNKRIIEEIRMVKTSTKASSLPAGQARWRGDSELFMATPRSQDKAHVWSN
jgi:hypothetical protein